MRPRPHRTTRRQVGLGVVVLAVAAVGAYLASVVVVGVLRGSRGSDPGIYWPALVLIALVAIMCGLIVRRLLKRRNHPAPPRR